MSDDNVQSTREAVLAVRSDVEALGGVVDRLEALFVEGFEEHTLHSYSGEERRRINNILASLDAIAGDLSEPAAEIASRIGQVFPLEPIEPGYRGEVARRWRYRDGAGEIGIISSVSQPFCTDGSRARLSAEGRLYTCRSEERRVGKECRL